MKISLIVSRSNADTQAGFAPRASRIGLAVVCVVLAGGVACDGGGSGEPSLAASNDALAQSAARVSAAATPALPVPANAIVPDAAGVLAPTGEGALTVGDRGDAHQHIPIWVPPGRAGIEPKLSLEYSSGGGNGLTGVGWGLAGLSRITRCPSLRQYGNVSLPIGWDNYDSYCLDGEPLVTSDHYFYRRFHDDGSLIVHYDASKSPDTNPLDHWLLRGKDGRVLKFGSTTDSRVNVKRNLLAPAVMTYALSRVEDRAGNFMSVSYESLNGGGDIRPHSIDYAGSKADATTRRSVAFFYDFVRPDVDQRVVAEQYFTYPERLVRLEMHAPNSAGMNTFRTFSIAYTTSPTTGRSLIANVAECDGAAPASIPVTGSTPLCRQQAFTYASGTPLTATNAFGITTVDTNGAEINDVSELGVEGVPPTMRLLDVDADGKDDLLYLSSDASETYHLRFSTGTGFGPAVNTGIPASYPAGITPPVVGTSAPLVLDFNGDGHADILVNQGASTAPVTHLYLATLINGQWTLGPPGPELLLFPAFNYFQSADLNGDSRPDLVMLQNGVGYYSINTDGTPQGLSPPALIPNQNNTSYNQAFTNYFLDLNNDGITEMMTSVWTDNTCIGHKTGDLNCDCKKRSYGALDISPHLYDYSGTPPSAMTTVGGLKVCTGAIDITPYTPFFGDFNGDGVVDVLQTYTSIDPNLTDPPLNLALALGGGDQSFTPQTTGGTFTLPNPVSFQTIDADLDGKTDLLVRTGTTTPYTVYSWKNQKWVSTPLPMTEEPGFYAATQGLMATGDVNGDGVPDFVAYAGIGSNVVGRVVTYTRNAAPARADLLTGASGDFGPKTTVRYAPYLVDAAEDRTDCQTPVACATRAGHLVTEIDVDNGIGGTNAQHHTYASGRVDPLGWGFLGFKTHKIVDDATGAITTRTFDFTPNTSGATPFFPRVGLPSLVLGTVVYNSGGQSITRFTRVDTGYAVQGNGPFMALPTVVESVVSDSNFGGPLVSKSVSRAFDAYGNMTFEDELDLIEPEERTTTTTYLNDTTNWIIGRPTYVSVTSTVGPRSAKRDTAYTYDALGQLAVQIDNPGPANGSSYDPLPPQDDGVQTLYTRTTRDGNGMPTLVEKLDNLASPTQRRATAIAYDATEAMFVAQTTDPVGLVTKTAYEPGLGVLAAQADAAGVVTTYQYDTFGRIRADHPAAGGDRVVFYHAPTVGNFGTVDDHRLGQYSATSKLDSLHRTVATTTTGRADGKPVSTETTYDVLGRRRSVSRPHFAGVTAAQTVTSYDTLGRVTQTTGADGAVQTTTYLGHRITTTNPDGNMSQVTNDSLGRPLTSVQATTTGPGGLTGPVTTTTLTYGPFGTLDSSTDPLGNVISPTYDRLGRVTIKLDRDSNATGFTYDVFGQVVDHVRGAQLMFLAFGGHVRIVLIGGTRTAMSYDGDGRMVTKVGPDVAQTFTWDTVHPGKLSSATITGGTSIAYTYDAFGNAKTKTWAGPRGPIGYTYTYDKYNRLATTTYPALPAATHQAPLVVQNIYSGGDVGGQLVAVNDVAAPTKPYWTLKATDASEAFAVSDLRNGVETTLGEDPAHPGWLKTITSKVGTTTTVQALNYVREGGGRVVQRSDTRNGITESFGYDGLERLTSWTWTGAAGARGAQYVYDDIGNLLQRNITAGPGASVTYSYGGNGFGPHQLSSDGGATAFAYDKQGNQLVAPGRSFTFNAFDRPTSVTATAGTYQMTYDADLARFSRTDPTSHTRYSYGGLFDEFSDAAGTHYVSKVIAAGHAVAEIEKLVKNNIVQSTTVNAILVDALGSVDALVGANGKPQAIKYDPFGARVTVTDPTVHMTTAPQDLRAGFTGHDHDDDVNLIDMIGRVYDPVTQRFLSVDPPAPSPVDGQAYNPYSYVRNNPLNATDPTGYLEVQLEGLHWGFNNNEAYGSYAWFRGSGYNVLITYGPSKAAAQGSSGTEGTGAIGNDGILALTKDSFVADGYGRNAGSDAGHAGTFVANAQGGPFGVEYMDNGEDWSLRIDPGLPFSRAIKAALTKAGWFASLPSYERTNAYLNDLLDHADAVRRVERNSMARPSLTPSREALGLPAASNVSLIDRLNTDMPFMTGAGPVGILIMILSEVHDLVRGGDTTQDALARIKMVRPIDDMIGSGLYSFSRADANVLGRDVRPLTPQAQTGSLSPAR